MSEPKVATCRYCDGTGVVAESAGASEIVAQLSASRLDSIRAFYKHRPVGDAWFLVEIVDDLLAALKQVEAEMSAGLGSSYGETREQVRRAIAKAEAA